MIEKQNNDEEDSNLLLTFPGKDAFLSKASGDKGFVDEQ